MGCKVSKVNNSEVGSRCKKRKRMMSEAVKYRQEFATAHLAYIDTLKQVGHGLLQYADRQPSDMEVMPKSIAQTNGEVPPKPSVKPSTKPPTSPSKSPTTHTRSPPLAASVGEQQGPSHPKSDGTRLSSTSSLPVKHENSETVMSNGASSPTFQSLVQELSGDGLMSSLPSSPTGAAPYYELTQPSSPQYSEWDPFNLFSALPFRSPEQTTKQFQDWDAVPQADDFVGVDGIPDLEDDETGQNIELNESIKVSTEQSLGEVKIVESLGKHEKKQIRSNAEKVLERIDEDSAEEEEAPVVDTNVKGKENGLAQEVKDLPGITICGVKHISECMKELNDTFSRASESGHEVSKMLETQIVYPRSRILNFSDSFRFSNTISRQWSRKSVSRRMEIDESDDDLEQRDIFGSHSLTLERLYTWEKKLYKEVKLGEQLHVAFSRKRKEFHSLDGKGKDLDLIEECRSDMKSLESQLMVSFRAISSASIRIQQVTNEELYPQLIELLRRLKVMWKAMLECHTAQKAPAIEIRSIEKSGHKLAASEAHRNAAVKLENQLELWQERLRVWVISQQNYIDTLLIWIKVCHMEPEADVKSGATSPAWTREKTPIYLLAKKWHDSLLSLEKNTVVDAIKKFSDTVHDIQLSELEELAETKKAEMLLTRSSSTDRRNRKGNAGRARTEDQDKSVSDESQREDAVLLSLQQHLPGIFEALTTFSSVACREYEKLHNEADPLTKK